jgi:hypothetical protein
LVHSLAFLSCCGLFLWYNCAISPTRGSAGFGSVRRERLQQDCQYRSCFGPGESHTWTRPL